MITPRLCFDTVAVAGGLAGDDDAEGVRAFIRRLVLLARGDFDAFAFLKDEVVIFDFDGQFAFEDVEELAGVDVGVADFLGSGRHELFDDAQVRRPDQVPAVTVGRLEASPFIVFGGAGADYFRGHV